MVMGNIYHHVEDVANYFLSTVVMKMLFMTPEGAKPFSELLPWAFGPEDLK